LDDLEEKGELELKENETVPDWIRRINAQIPDPWASVKRFRVEAWVKRHLIKKRRPRDDL